MSEKTYNLGILESNGFMKGFYGEALKSSNINSEWFQDAGEALQRFTTKPYDLILIEGVSDTLNPKDQGLAKIVHEEVDLKSHTPQYPDYTRISSYIIQKTREPSSKNKDTYILGLGILDPCGVWPHIEETLLAAGASEFIWPFAEEKEGESSEDFEERLIKYFVTKINSTLKKI